MQPTLPRVNFSLCLMLMQSLGTSAAPAFMAPAGNFGRVGLQSARHHALPEGVRALGGSTDDLNAMDHDVKGLIGSTFDTALCMLLVPLSAPFLLLFLGAFTQTEEKRRNRANEEESWQALPLLEVVIEDAIDTDAIV
eukprot:gnl/MRDRNA2_/MRDRNA2_116838_c0_seq1.p1 gnl/MRDRNA2_/MRDRNA2_116838_c0~~gnl/MRDRNA2_/MRDRNA2_116838_c0_seq1.p1  ORF type:complete len:138 (+),score=23.15 gnl/MRDRNA2_/MRDRNA2_116838_c0_seq1:77-490(+)